MESNQSRGEWFDDFLAGFMAYSLTGLPVLAGLLCHRARRMRAAWLRRSGSGTMVFVLRLGSANRAAARVGCRHPAPPTAAKGAAGGSLVRVASTARSLMNFKWFCYLATAISIVYCESRPCWLSAKETPGDQEKWLFLLDQVRSHSERLKSGECTISGRMYAPRRPKTIGIDPKFDIRLAFVRPLKCRWEGASPVGLSTSRSSGVDANGQPTAGVKFDEKTVLFASNGPDAAYWDSDQ